MKNQTTFDNSKYMGKPILNESDKAIGFNLCVNHKRNNKILKEFETPGGVRWVFSDKGISLLQKLNEKGISSKA